MRDLATPSTVYKWGFSGRGFSDLGQVQGQDQDQGQAQDHLLLQRAALPPFLVLALTLVLVLTLALAPSGMISKKGVPTFFPTTDWSAFGLQRTPRVKNPGEKKTYQTLSP